MYSCAAGRLEPASRTDRQRRNGRGRLRSFRLGDGNTVVVGAPGDNTAAGEDAGSAYVFVRSGTFWSQQAKLTASDGVVGDVLRRVRLCGREHCGGRSAWGHTAAALGRWLGVCIRAPRNDGLEPASQTDRQRRRGK